MGLYMNLKLREALLHDIAWIVAPEAPATTEDYAKAERILVRVEAAHPPQSEPQPSRAPFAEQSERWNCTLFASISSPDAPQSEPQGLREAAQKACDYYFKDHGDYKYLLSEHEEHMKCLRSALAAAPADGGLRAVVKEIIKDWKSEAFHGTPASSYAEVLERRIAALSSLPTTPRETREEAMARLDRDIAEGKLLKPATPEGAQEAGK